MLNLITRLGAEYCSNDFTACSGAIDMLKERGYSHERMIRFLQRWYHINDVQALEVLEMLNIFIIN